MSRVSTISPKSRKCWGRYLATSAILLVLPAAAQAQSIDYQQVEALFGEPVTTSVTGKPQRASEAPAALVIITRDDIRRSPAKDIVGLLGAYAGVDVARWTAGQSDVSIRGGAQPFNPRLLVLVNGQQVYLDSYGMTNWAGLGVQLEDIQQIEIVRGPNSALFGFNATSGVINIITINPLQTQQTTLSADVGDRGYGSLSANMAVKLGDQFGLRLSGGYGESDELAGLERSSIVPSARRGPLDPQHAEVAAELYGRFGGGTEAVLSASRSSNRLAEFNESLTSFQSRDSFKSLGARVSHDTGWGVLSGRVYQNRSAETAQLDVTPGDNHPDVLEFRNKVLVASGAALVRLDGANTARVGVEYRDNQLRSNSGYPGATRDHLYALNGMWESALTDTVTLTLAGRLDRLKLEQEGMVDQPSIFTKKDFDRTIDVGSFNSSLVFKLDDYSTLRVAAARGVQAPSLFSLGARFVIPVAGLPFPFVVSGDPSLRPSKIQSGEVGFTRVLDDHGGRLELTGFYHLTQDIVGTPAPSATPRRGPPAYPFILIASDNIGSFQAFGVEASIAGRLGQTVSWSANYTWTKASEDIKGERGDTFEWPIALDRSTPEHKLQAQVSYEQGAWLGTVAARYTSAIQQLVFVGRLKLIDIDNTVAIDAKLGYRLSPKITVEIAGENLTDEGGVDLSPAPAERRLRAGIRVSF